MTHKQWLRLRWRKWVVYPFCRRFFRDNGGDSQPTILVAGAGRSGTTWLAEIIASQLSCRLMYEPFHNQYVPAFSQFSYFPYRRPTDPDPALYTFCHTLFSGNFRHPWIDKEIAHLFPQHRLIKAIRANLMLGWLHCQFPTLPKLFIIRHPCAVVASRLKLNWAADGDIQPFLDQPQLAGDFLQNKLSLIKNADSPATKHAIIWCISNLVPLQQLQNHPVPIIFYENLLTQPEIEIPKIFQAINQPYTPAVFDQLQRLSSASTQQSLNHKNQLNSWQKSLSPAQIEQIYATVHAFGLQWLYGESTLPRV